MDAESGNKWATSKGGNPLWTRPDGKTWREQAKEWGVKHESNCVCVPAADFDNDGDLDLLLVNFYSNVVLYRNNTNDKNWLRVKAVGSKSNRDGIGAKVSVYAEGGAKQLVGFREIQSGLGLRPVVAAGGPLRFGEDAGGQLPHRGVLPGDEEASREGEGQAGSAPRRA